jgi:hypothetical protein
MRSWSLVSPAFATSLQAVSIGHPTSAPVQVKLKDAIHIDPCNHSRLHLPPDAICPTSNTPADQGAERNLADDGQDGGGMTAPKGGSNSLSIPPSEIVTKTENISHRRFRRWP